METAKMVITLLLNLALFLPCLSAAIPYQRRCHPSFNPSMCKGPITGGHGYSYTRFADVERRCQSVLSSAAELKPDAYRDGNQLYHLSFTNGDWSQDAGQAPLFPFHGSYADPAVAGPPGSLLEAVPLASFSLREMENTAQRPGPRTAFNASGILSFTMARNSSCSESEFGMQMEPPPCPLPEFNLRPGIAKLQIVFQGVYTETRPSENGGGGERVLCMVGDAVLPVRSSNSTDPWHWAKNENLGRGSSNSSNLEFKPPVVSDGNILLVLRYPKTPTLTTRAVHGVMSSTNAESDGAYFDAIRLVSQVRGGFGYTSSGYQFRQEDTPPELDAAAPCDEDADAAMEMEHGHPLNRGASSPCDIIYESIPSNQVMEVISNWNCTGTDEFCSRLGPFMSSSSSRPAATETDDMAFTRSAIVVSGLDCKSICRNINGRAAARVAAVFRYVPPWEHLPMGAKRTGLNSMTLSAEGVWVPSTGRTEMVACLGVADNKEACRYRVTLSVKTTASMTCRGIVAGQITAVDDDDDGRRSHPPLLFQQRLGRFSLYGTSSRRRMSYVYTKVDQARELILGASKPTGFRDSFLGKSLLSYPSVTVDAGGSAHADMGSLSRLADELDLRYQCMGKPPPFVPEWIDRPFYELQILSAGTVVGRNYSPQVQRQSSMWNVVELLKRLVVHGEERQRMVLNVSAEFVAYGNCGGASPVMSLEGVYNAEDGRMYLIGCRNVHASRRRLLSMSNDLEDGMDCSIEVTVEYPPTITRWLISWSAKVFIVSTRDDDDPLHFNETELHMLPVINRQKRLDELTEPVVKGFLRIVVLLATIWAATRTCL